jgi:signal transduction histidine kinase
VAGGAIWLVYVLRKRNRNKQKKLIETLRTEEQKKIRQNTARDFHDEMGNKLARITVLSDILKTKIPANEEAQVLVKKIQENTALVYQGTKDIIWSLNPNNDNLYILVKHIHHFGVDLFLDTGIDFEAGPVDEAFRHYFLPMDFARNIMMICKEAFTNVLKHAQCSKVITSVELVDASRVVLTIKDDGKGFDPALTGSGNGLINIQQRADSLGATVQFESAIGCGTTMLLGFTLRPGAKQLNHGA